MADMDSTPERRMGLCPVVERKCTAAWPGKSRTAEIVRKDGRPGTVLGTAAVVDRGESWETL